MENSPQSRPWLQMLVLATMGALVCHYLTRLGFWPFEFWFLDIFLLIELITSLPSFVKLIRDRAALKRLFADRVAVALFGFSLVLGLISGWLISYSLQ